MAYSATRFERPLEPREGKYIPVMTEEEKTRLSRQFCKDLVDEFVEFIENYDSCIFWDFIESVRWKWSAYKEENRSYE